MIRVGLTEVKKLRKPRSNIASCMMINLLMKLANDGLVDNMCYLMIIAKEKRALKIIVGKEKEKRETSRRGFTQ